MRSNISRKGGRSVTFIAALGISLSVSMSSYAGNCVRASETDALSIRLVQTELMVAALTCRHKAEYNTFVRKFETELVARGKALKTLFLRLHGNRAEQQLNRFVTRLANEASLRSIEKSRYCSAAASLFQSTLQVEPGHLAAFAALQPFSRRHGLPLCDPDSQVSDAERAVPAVK